MLYKKYIIEVTIEENDIDSLVSTVNDNNYGFNYDITPMNKYINTVK